MTEHYDFYNKTHFKGRLPPMRIYYGPLAKRKRLSSMALLLLRDAIALCTLC